MRKIVWGLVRACAVSVGMWGIPGVVHAQSSVSLYGLIDAFVGETHAPGAAGSAWQVGSGGMTTSYWGVSGSEDLGHGMKAVFTLESFFRVNAGQLGSFNGQSFFGRNAFVGLSGGFGEVTVGRNTAPLFVSTLLFNPFGNSFAFSPMISHGYLGSAMGAASVQSDTAIDSSVLYQTPEVGGLSASLLYSNAGVAGHAGQANYSANVLYFAGSFSATAAVQSLHTASLFLNGATAQTAWLVGGAYRIDATKLMFQYERVSNNSNVTDDTVQVGASARFGMGSMLLSWAGTRRRPVTGFDIRWSTFALGYDYPLSKRTDIYAAWRYDTITHASSGNGVGAGVRVRF
ncbi:porin [Burkholderia sp. NRF60-BP8]|uniref:porin n=1 Tax=Burkholderia sp. NRF60-BP8 TaxID=1637853 RepID=UPI00075B0FE8|nr:porin [Burkholderia sp. NRF60-BP8]AOI74988.1 porin [Burkholderia sp. NRF60-BP8]KVA11647.1 porin [Burkholderia sp. NRF60-BP8]